MPDIDLDAIEARANAATDGPWVVKHEPAWEADNVQHPDVITVGAQMWEADDEPMTVCLVSTDHEDDPVDVLLDAEFIAHARTDVPALVALVRAKQSWIDGAKVDMAAMEEERAKALAAVALAGEEIERASVEVKRADRQRDDARAAIAAVRALCDHADSGLHAGLTMVSVAAVRGAILAALDVRHDPSATTDGGAS